jgi:translation initiation factor 3 subunit D
VSIARDVLELEPRADECSESHGTLQAYDKAFDRINTRNEKPLEIIGRVRYNVSTSDDPIMNQVSNLNLTVTRGSWR